MLIFELTLTVAALLCSLVSGFVFAFAVVVMPGIGRLGDGAFLRAFQVMDRVIQNNQPVFLLVWVGSAVALLASAGIGFGHLDETGRLLVVGAAVVYVLGVQLPTLAINIPLNNRVQALDTGGMDEAALQAARLEFERRWIYWNAVRTVVACLVSVLLLAQLLRL